MTDLNNSNDEQQRPSRDGAQDGTEHGTESSGEDTSSSQDKRHTSDAEENSQDADLWAQFEKDHAQDLGAIAKSREAKRFEHHAARKEKKRLLSVDDLDQGSFTDDLPRSGGGPRDFANSSWLNTDDVMDAMGDDFTPPNPTIGHIPTATLVFWILLVLGVIGVIASVFVPALTGPLGTIFGTCTLIGGAGLVFLHQDRPRTDENVFDDGSRV